jgi:hypothetical protein
VQLGMFITSAPSWKNVFDIHRSSEDCSLSELVGPNLHIARESQSRCRRAGLPSLVERHSEEQDVSFSHQTLAEYSANFDVRCERCGVGREKGNDLSMHNTGGDFLPAIACSFALRPRDLKKKPLVIYASSNHQIVCEIMTVLLL